MTTLSYDIFAYFFFIRETLFQSTISVLKEELVRAQTLVREANALATELKKDTEFTVTMRIPIYNLTPNRKVIEVSRRHSSFHLPLLRHSGMI